MRKIPTLFCKDQKQRYCIPRYKIVLTPQAVPLQKFDGTAMYLDMQDVWHRRLTTKSPPPNFVWCTTDRFSGKQTGWVPLRAADPFFKQHYEALQNLPLDLDFMPGHRDERYEPGTYELLGPKINGNPERLSTHRLMPHRHAPQISNISLLEIPTLSVEESYTALKITLENIEIEGVVFWENNNDKFAPVAKLRRKDFDYG